MLKTHLKDIFWVLIVLLLIPGCAGKARSPEPEHVEQPTPESSGSRGKEMGKTFVYQTLKEFKFVKDPEIVSLVNRVGRKIVSAQGSDPTMYRFLVVKGAVPNAFALPGGYIYIFDSLIDKMRSARELSGILAHEIAHVERNHHFKDESKINAATLATLAAIILSGGDPAVTMAGMAANVELQLHYSRENESEADTYAVKLLRKAGYDPRSLLESFQTLAFYEQFNAPETPIYFSTHPGLDQRQIQLELMLRQEEYDRPFRKLSVDWDRIVVGLKAQKHAVSDIPLLVRGLEGVSENPERQHYLLGVAYLKAGHFVKAVDEYKAAIELNPSSAGYHADLSQCFLQLKKIEEAQSEAKSALELDPNHTAALTVLGRLEGYKERYSEAIDLLSRAEKSQPYDPMIYLSLAQSYAGVDDKARHAYYLGRFLRLSLKPHEAFREFQRAQKLVPKDSDLSLKIEKELAELRRDGI